MQVCVCMPILRYTSQVSSEKRKKKLNILTPTNDEGGPHTDRANHYCSGGAHKICGGSYCSKILLIKAVKPQLNRIPIKSIPVCDITKEYNILCIYLDVRTTRVRLARAKCSRHRAPVRVTGTLGIPKKTFFYSPSCYIKHLNSKENISAISARKSLRICRNSSVARISRGKEGAIFS